MNGLMAAILEILPFATFGEDNEGQVIIYTGVKEEKDGSVVQFEA
jgi:hypothetical protein